MSISDVETESGNEKEDASDKEEIEENPEKHAKNTKYTKEDFIARKHGSEKEPWVQKPMPFPDKKHKTVVESSEIVKDPNSVSISDAENESGNDNNDASDKVENGLSETTKRKKF